MTIQCQILNFKYFFIFIFYHLNFGFDLSLEIYHLSFNTLYLSLEIGNLSFKLTLRRSSILPHLSIDKKYFLVFLVCHWKLEICHFNLF